MTDMMSISSMDHFHLKPKHFLGDVEKADAISISSIDGSPRTLRKPKLNNDETAELLSITKFDCF